jgi:DNA-directed RNA polymerase subunit RPC12/RpoP
MATPEAAPPAQASTDNGHREKRCKHCGFLVIGGHRERVNHLKQCSSAATIKAGKDRNNSPVPTAQQRARSPSSGGVQLKTLPVCSLCGKLFRNNAVLAEHKCPWEASRRSSPPPPAAGPQPFRVSATPDPKPAKLGRIDTFNRERHSLNDYDARITHLLQRQCGLTSTPDPKHQPLASVTRGARRVACELCGKPHLSTMRDLHRESCIVERLQQRLDMLREIVTMGGSAGAALPPAAETTSTVTAEFARQQEVDKSLGALEMVIRLPVGLRKANAAVSFASVRGALPQIDESFDAWKANMRSRLPQLTSPASFSYAGQHDCGGAAAASPLTLRTLLHSPMVIDTGAPKAATDATLARCASLAASKTTARPGTPEFDARILKLADAVRKGDITLEDATQGREFRATVHSYPDAVSPALRK